jgi:hypothetical protein
MSATMTLSHPDELCDLTAEVVTTDAATKARDRRISKAMDAGVDYCSACGRPINHAKATRVVFTDSAETAWLGPECVKKVSPA